LYFTKNQSTSAARLRNNAMQLPLANLPPVNLIKDKGAEE